MVEGKVVLTQAHRPLRQLVATTGSGHHLILDDIIGGTGPQPIELVAVSLAGCTAFDVISHLRYKRFQQVTAYEVRVEAEQADNSPQVFTSVRIHHILAGPEIDPDAVNEAIELSNNRHGAVYAMLRPSTSLTTSFEILVEMASAVAATQ